MHAGSSDASCASPPSSGSVAARAAAANGGPSSSSASDSTMGGDSRHAGLTSASAWGCCTGGPVPVDSEGKAKRLRPLSCAPPHMRSFTVAWLAHFCAVFATFAAAPLLPVIRDDLDLTKAQISAAGIAAVAGTVVSRVAMGGVCDRWGPRHGAAALLLLTSCASFGMALVSNAAGYIAARLLIGTALASFVTCQFWCSVMFAPRIVGTANAVAAGWGNSAGGIVQLLMPLLLKGMELEQPSFVAWRTCYLVVGWMQVVVGLMVLLCGQDLPAGNYGALRRSGSMQRANTKHEYLAACRNYRTWILCIVYGFSFGTELTMNNILSQYLYDQFSVSLTQAGAMASVFGLVNLFARPAGGMISDWASHRWGMRGRLWSLYLLQSAAAAFCCGLSQVGGSLGGTMALVSCMAVSVTAAAGATFGVIPFVSRRGLGAVNGIVGSGSSLGSILLQGLYFTGSSISWSQGFLRMGITSAAATLLLLTIHFPAWGGMLPASWLPPWRCRTEARAAAGGAAPPGGAGWPCTGGAAPLVGAGKAGDDTLARLSAEEAYYSADFTPEERRLGLHASVLAFAAESKSQRGAARGGQHRTRTPSAAAAAAHGAGAGVPGSGGSNGSVPVPLPPASAAAQECAESGQQAGPPPPVNGASL